MAIRVIITSTSRRLLPAFATAVAFVAATCVALPAAEPLPLPPVSDAPAAAATDVIVEVRFAPVVAVGPGFATRLMVSKPVAVKTPMVVAAAVVVPKPAVIVRTSDVPVAVASVSVVAPILARAVTLAA
jgi:hypothetical protein